MALFRIVSGLAEFYATQWNVRNAADNNITHKLRSKINLFEYARKLMKICIYDSYA